MTTQHGHGESLATGSRLYWGLFAVLAALTLAEWALFVMRTSVSFGAERLVPWLLALTALKFGLVVAWFMQPQNDAGWSRKALLVALVIGGGLVLAPRILMFN